MQYKETIRKVVVFLADMVFPKNIYCIACGAPLGGGDPASLCGKCREELIENRPPVCRRCGRFARFPARGSCEGCRKRIPAYDRGTAAVVYERGARKILYGLKYGGKGYLAENIAAIMEPVLPAASSYDMIIPVPMHKSKKSERGYCQTTLISRHLAKKSGKPAETDNLVRIRRTEPMSGLHRGNRAANVRGAFEVKDPGALAGKRILLVDDLLTTGSTADECARILKKAGAASVQLAVFAATAPDRAS